MLRDFIQDNNSALESTIDMALFAGVDEDIILEADLGKMKSAIKEKVSKYTTKVREFIQKYMDKVKAFFLKLAKKETISVDQGIYNKVKKEMNALKFGFKESYTLGKMIAMNNKINKANVEGQRDAYNRQKAPLIAQIQKAVSNYNEVISKVSDDVNNILDFKNGHMLTLNASSFSDQKNVIFLAIKTLEVAHKNNEEASKAENLDTDVVRELMSLTSIQLKHANLLYRLINLIG